MCVHEWAWNIWAPSFWRWIVELWTHDGRNILKKIVAWLKANDVTLPETQKKSRRLMENSHSHWMFSGNVLVNMTENIHAALSSVPLVVEKWNALNVNLVKWMEANMFKSDVYFKWKWMYDGNVRFILLRLISFDMDFR